MFRVHLGSEILLGFPPEAPKGFQRVGIQEISGVFEGFAGGSGRLRGVSGNSKRL